ncbi:DUF916 and DUF3324 domain-containing protein [Enterococcus thailandicus]|uniref:Cell surface protein n=1 Tax=Enterococcus thailandicus TaxID=417368 RepID=A0A510WEC4_ENTTH|nr:DUF916 and DUF3324 domain-containing protein [Enterococcus thailandicus]GEK37529.1 cell surface protein [Enterococcus thailandicus]
MRRVVVGLICFASVVGLFFTGGSVVEASSPDFSVQAVLPESQTNEGVSYFDINLEPKQEETLAVQVTNNSEEEMTLDIGVNTATTNSNGVINYGFSEAEPDDTLPVNFAEIVELEDQAITLAANETRTVEAKVKMPEQSFDGILLGGITVSEQVPESESQITNRFSYSLAVVINQTDQEISPVVDLTQVNVDQRNRRSFVIGSIQNQAAMILNDVQVEAQVFEKGNETPIYTEARGDMRMAPNSTLPFGISTGTKPLQAGDYRLKMVVASGKEEWQFEKNFTITAKEARELNEKAVNLETNRTGLYLAIASGVVVLLLLVIAWLVYSKRKKK